MCAHRPWHKWGAWGIGEVTYESGPLSMRLDPNGPREYTVLRRTRQCERCLKVQVK